MKKNLQLSPANAASLKVAHYEAHILIVQKYKI